MKEKVQKLISEAEDLERYARDGRKGTEARGLALLQANNLRLQALTLTIGQ